MRPDNLPGFEVDGVDAPELAVVAWSGLAPQPKVIATRGDFGRLAGCPAVVHAVVRREGYVQVAGGGVDRRRRPVACPGGHGTDQIGAACLGFELRLVD